MATGDFVYPPNAPTGNAQSSDQVAPVTASQIPVGKLVHVGARSSGLPSGSNLLDSLVTKAYDLAAQKVMRRQIVFDMVSTVQPTNQSHPGAVVGFNVVNDLDDDPSTAALAEDYDVLPTPLTSWDSNVILNEYGRVVSRTQLFKGVSMVPFDPVIAERVARNAVATIERLAFSSLIASGGITNTGGAGGAVTDVTVNDSPSDTLRAALQKFKENNVAPLSNGRYLAVLDPAAETALRKEADAAGWRYWQANDPNAPGIINGFVGSYEGFDIVTSNITGLSTLGGVFVGKDALAKAFPIVPGFSGGPQIVVSPVVDKLKRFASVGWYWLGGYARFRAEAVLTGDCAATS